MADPAANPANSTKQIMWTCGAGEQTYTTPATGTSLTAGQTQIVAYDEEGRTRTVVTGDGLTPKKTDYLYDADGNLLIERDPGSTVLYLFAGIEQLTLTTSTDKVTGLRYYGNPDGTTIVRSSAGKLTYLPSNPQGTSQVEVDAGTLAVTRRAYDPYGAPRGTVPTSWADNHGYLGQPTDPGSGLDLLGARDYDSALGRFLSADPVFEPGDPNQMGGYAYAGDDPVNGSDPSGLMLDGGGDCSLLPGGCNPDPPTNTKSGSSTGSDTDRAIKAADGVAGSVTSLINVGLPSPVHLTTHPFAKWLGADTHSLNYQVGDVAGNVATLFIPGVGEEAAGADLFGSIGLEARLRREPMAADSLTGF